MWHEYVPVRAQREKAAKILAKLRKKKQPIEPVVIEGRAIARKWWGKKWCQHLESFADYENRLPRGRSYARHGAICHLSIDKGGCDALVSGASLYRVFINIKILPEPKWLSIKERCCGQIGSILELLQGKFSDQVMQVVADHQEGLFPLPKEMEFSCNCPDWAGMCKHIAAVLYGIGNRLDEQPELLFKLRGVDPSELIAAPFNLADAKTDQLPDQSLAEIFGIELENSL
jgi:uncharacterized Zn finger protein